MTDNIETVHGELAGESDEQTQQSADSESPSETPQPNQSDRLAVESFALEQSFASRYLDELILAILLRYDEINGMDVIRELTHVFGVHFSPGTVYPHLHTLEDEGILALRECVQTKEYRIQDEEAARARLESTFGQLHRLITYFDTVRSTSELTE